MVPPSARDRFDAARLINIANGLTAGLLLAPLCKLLAGRWREVTPGGATLGVVCLAYYLFGLPH